MLQVSRIERRNLLTGWIKWALLPAIPFSVLFFDAWLNVQIRHKDYELSQLNSARRELNAAMDATRAYEAAILGVDNLSVMAEKMHLASPGSQQFKTVAYREVPRRISVMNLAQNNATSALVAIDLVERKVETVSAPLAPKPEDAVVADAVWTPAPIEPPQEPVVTTAMHIEAAPHPDAAPAQGHPEVVSQLYYEDPELSLLTVEDMLGRL